MRNSLTDRSQLYLHHCLPHGVPGSTPISPEVLPLHAADDQAAPHHAAGLALHQAEVPLGAPELPAVQCPGEGLDPGHGRGGARQ